MSTSCEPLLCETLRAQAELMRVIANNMDALAIANTDGKASDMLRSGDVQQILNCSASKACQIIRAHGIGAGKMARIERGTLMQLQREGKL